MDLMSSSLVPLATVHMGAVQVKGLASDRSFFGAILAGATILVSGEAVQFGEIFRDGIIIERAGNILIQILRIGIELASVPPSVRQS